MAIKIRERLNLIKNLVETRGISEQEAKEFYDRMPRKERQRRVDVLGNVPIKSRQKK